MEFWIVSVVAVIMLAGGGVWLLSRKKDRAEGAPPALPQDAPVSKPIDREPARPPPVAAVKPGLSSRLGGTRGNFFGRLGKYFGRTSGDWQDGEWDEVEEILLSADVGVVTTRHLLGRLRDRLKQSDGQILRDIIREESESLLAGLEHGFALRTLPKPLVVSVVGVNGAGKTTTIGKLAHWFSGSGKHVLIGACDTFRAAAIGQLKVWAERTGAQFVTGREGADPGAIAFDSVTAGAARGLDVVLLDTAGRLHTKINLMEELKKIHRVVKKVIPDAPHETWLVLDGTTGQNAIVQAREFQKALELTGVIITKLDGTAKGGAILAVASELKLPIKFIGVGESAADLIPFEPRPFVQAILGEA